MNFYSIFSQFSRKATDIQKKYEKTRPNMMGDVSLVLSHEKV